MCKKRNLTQDEAEAIVAEFEKQKISMSTGLNSSTNVEFGLVCPTFGNTLLAAVNFKNDVKN